MGTQYNRHNETFLVSTQNKCVTDGTKIFKKLRPKFVFIWRPDCFLVLYSKSVLSGHSKRTPKLVFNTNNGLMQVKRIAECSPMEHSAILLTFIKLPFSIKAIILSIFKSPLKTGFTVQFKPKH